MRIQVGGLSEGVHEYSFRTTPAELGLPAGIPVTYRAGDQPNTALSLNVLEPGEVAATAGTSGVVYAVSGTLARDPESRVNSFAHVNYDGGRAAGQGGKTPRIGVLLCINGCGIALSWTRRILGKAERPYEEMNALAAEAPTRSRRAAPSRGSAPPASMGAGGLGGAPLALTAAIAASGPEEDKAFSASETESSKDA